MDQSERLAAVERLIADPPQIYLFAGSGQTPAPGGVWLTDRECYEFLASSCLPSARTLETDVGLSTVLFALLSTSHTCVAPFQAEVDECIAYLDSREILRDRLTFHVGWSEDVLPRLEPTPLDLVFIDGGHAFPFPIIDWYYAGARLVTNGILVVDDGQLPAVSEAFLQFLDRDRLWALIQSTHKWCPYRRLTHGQMKESWVEQHERGMFARRLPPASRVGSGRFAADSCRAADTRSVPTRPFALPHHERHED
jgi:hypothetical protein